MPAEKRVITVSEDELKRLVHVMVAAELDGYVESDPEEWVLPATSAMRKQVEMVIASRMSNPKLSLWKAANWAIRRVTGGYSSARNLYRYCAEHPMYMYVWREIYRTLGHVRALS